MKPNNYRINNEYLILEIAAKGAEMQSIKGADGTEYLWQGDVAIWKDRAFNIFPYVARLYEERYQYKGKEYQLPIHGFLKDCELAVTMLVDNKIKFTLEADEQTKSMYPFDFVLSIMYELVGSKIVITMTVVNQGDETMYFGIGGHPGFIVPIAEIGKFEDYYLEFADAQTPNRVGSNQDSLLLNGQEMPFALKGQRVLPLTHEIFDDDAIILKDMSRTVTLKSDINNKAITISYPDMKRLGLWHVPKVEAKYVCIEPWTSLQGRDGMIEDIAKQEDLIRLEGKKEYRNEWSISIVE